MDEEICFSKIIEQEAITTVFQPIVSLENGSILGYEALSRISLDDCVINIESLFELAHKTDRLWELEKLCRKKALQNAATKPLNALIFLNVDANIIHDHDFKSGFTSEKLHEYGISEDKIIFEITEKTATTNLDIFTTSIEHYQKQNFKIAIDDFGSGYSGLNRVCSISPDFLKIDMHLVRNIDSDSVKKSAVTAMVEFCKKANIQVIAEGIETEAELKALIRMGVTYGQGYYLSRPNADFLKLTSDVKLFIKNTYNKSKLYYTPMFFCKIADLGTPKPTVKYSDSSFDIFVKMKNDSSISEFFVVDDDDIVCGVLTRRLIVEKFGGQYGYHLSKKTKVANIIQRDCLVVDENLSVDRVSEIAMLRNQDCVYDSIAITRDEKYLCTVTVKDLLLSSIQVQIKRATDANPLTGLPGNHQIQQVVLSTFVKETPWSIIYLDLDNFKAYNDAYGFSNGDLMLKAVSQVMETCANEGEFLGHIGGDDFVIVTDYHDVYPLCAQISQTFQRAIESLYSHSDWSRGYIVSKNRNGFSENFNIATLSISVVTNQFLRPQNMDALSKHIAETKKTAKQQEGNSMIII